MRASGLWPTLLGLLLLAPRPVWAQGAALPPSVGEMGRAVASLSQFRVDVETKTTDRARPEYHTEVLFRSPNQVRLRASAGQSGALAVSDGQTLAARSVDEGATQKYLSRPAAPDRVVVKDAAEVLEHGLAAAGIPAKGTGLGPLAPLLAGEDPFTGLGAVRETHEHEARRDGELVRVVSALFDPAGGPRRPARLEVEIGAEDRLPRRVTLGPAAEEPGLATVTVTFSGWETQPTVAEDAFRFTPPRGAKPVTATKKTEPGAAQLLLGVLIVGAALWALVRQWDVRLALTLAALALGAVAGDPMAIVRKFFATLADEKYVVPICSAMGFAFVLRHTLCDQHLVHLLAHPLRRARPLLIPGAVLVGYLVNIPVISQTSTAVAIGSVVIPLLLAAHVSPVTSGAALLLGASIGGELFNPGAPEYRTVIEKSNELAAWSGHWSLLPVTLDATACVQRAALLNLVQMVVTTAVFWVLSFRAEAAHRREVAIAEYREEHEPHMPAFKVNPLKALIPVVPLAILFLVGGNLRKPTQVITLPQEWLVDVKSKLDQVAPASTFDSRLIGAAMLVGVVLAALSAPGLARGTAKAFFEGAGYALTQVVAIIVAAACFGEGFTQIGLAGLIGKLVTALPALLVPLAGIAPMLFSGVSGSGMAAAQSLFEFFGRPAWSLGLDPAQVGAVVSLGAAAGRTASPVAAVTLMCASLTETDPITLWKRAVPPVLAGLLAMLIAAVLLVR